MCRDRRNPAQPAIDPVPLLDAVNQITGNRFNALLPECAGFFLESILDSLALLPHFLTTHEEAGTCVLCQQPYRQVCTELTTCQSRPLPPQASVHHRHWMTVPVPVQQQAVDLAVSVAAIRALVPGQLHLASLTCNRGAAGKHCAGQPVPTRLDPVHGQF